MPVYHGGKEGMDGMPVDQGGEEGGGGMTKSRDGGPVEQGGEEGGDRIGGQESWRWDQIGTN